MYVYIVVAIVFACVKVWMLGKICFWGGGGLWYNYVLHWIFALGLVWFLVVLLGGVFGLMFVVLSRLLFVKLPLRISFFFFCVFASNPLKNIKLQIPLNLPCCCFFLTMVVSDILSVFRGFFCRVFIVDWFGFLDYWSRFICMLLGRGGFDWMVPFYLCFALMGFWCDISVGLYVCLSILYLCIVEPLLFGLSEKNCFRFF